MRTPLIRQGGGTTALHELYEQHEKKRREIRRMCDTANATETHQERRRRGLAGHRSAAGDEDRLRGIPVAMPGVPGHIPGTAPHHIR